MADLTRPDFGEAWASEGEKLSPDSVKIKLGWVQEMMPYQFENFLQSRQDEAILYLLQKGVPEYSPTQEYTANKSVVVYQGNLYMATATVTGVLPTVTASWKRISPTVGTNGAVAISSGGTGATSVAEARTNLGLGTASTANLPSTNGVVVRSADNTLISRLLTGTSGNISITNPDGVAGNININVGSNVALLNTDSSWTSTGSIRLPSGSTSQQGTPTPGRVRFNLETDEFHGAYSDGWKVLAKPASAEQTAIADVGNFYTSSNVEGALQEVGSKVGFVKDAILFYPDYATASAAATTLPDGQMLEALNSDERLSYFVVQSGGLVFKDYVPDIIRLQSYAALRGYTGESLAVDIAAPAIAGRFHVDLADSITPDNGGTVIVGNDGRRWKRFFSGSVQTSWFEGENILQKALDSGASVVCVTAGTSIAFDTVTMSKDGQSLVLEAGSELQPQVPTAKAINVSGDGCSIFGPGTVKGKPEFYGLNERPEYGLIYVTGNRFTLDGVTIDTIPKSGIFFKDCTGHVVRNNRIKGRYPYTSYDENTTTGHYAVLSDHPPLSVDGAPHILITGNIIEDCIQGISLANLDSGEVNTGVTIVGNVFRNCWDHGVYMSRGKGHNITGNTFLNCRRPIVSDGINSVVTGNTLYATEDEVRSNCEQLISVRESSYSVISNNSIYGVDAGIFMDCLETTTCVGNRVEGNVIVSRGSRHATSCIRFGHGAADCKNNVIANNSLFINDALQTFVAIEGSILAGFFGEDNVIRGNTIKRTTPGPAISVFRNAFAKIENNNIFVSGDLTPAGSVDLISVLSSASVDVNNNGIRFSSGGAGVTAVGIHSDENSPSCFITENAFRIQGTLSAFTHVSAFGASSTVLRNKKDAAMRTAGSMTLLSGQTEIIVANPGVDANTVVNVIPRNYAAAVVVSNGYYVLSSAGTFRIVASVAAASDALFAYEVL